MAMTLKPNLNHPTGSVQKRWNRKKARQVPLNVKILLTVLFECNGVVHHEFLSQGHTVNKEYLLLCMYGYDKKAQSKLKRHTVNKESSSVKCEGFAYCALRMQWHGVRNEEYYLEVMCRLREVIRQIHTGLWENESWILHHDNALAQTSMLVRKVVRSIRNTTLKLCADCVKQCVRNAQNSGKTYHGFCTLITQQLIHRHLCVSSWPKTKPVAWFYSCQYQHNISCA